MKLYLDYLDNLCLNKVLELIRLKLFHNDCKKIWMSLISLNHGPIVLLELWYYIYDFKLLEEVEKNNFWLLITVLGIWITQPIFFESSFVCNLIFLNVPTDFVLIVQLLLTAENRVNESFNWNVPEDEVRIHNRLQSYYID